MSSKYRDSVEYADAFELAAKNAASSIDDLVKAEEGKGSPFEISLLRYITLTLMPLQTQNKTGEVP